MSGQSNDEAAAEAGRIAQAKGYGVKETMPGVEDELPPDMPVPKAEGEEHMGGVHKGNDGHIGNAGMGAAVSLLNEQTERRGAQPTVGGHTMDKYR